MVLVFLNLRVLYMPLETLFIMHLTYIGIINKYTMAKKTENAIIVRETQRRSLYLIVKISLSYI